MSFRIFRVISKPKILHVIMYQYLYAIAEDVQKHSILQAPKIWTCVLKRLIYIPMFICFIKHLFNLKSRCRQFCFFIVSVNIIYFFTVLFVLLVALYIWWTAKGTQQIVSGYLHSFEKRPYLWLAFILLENSIGNKNFIHKNY